MFDRDSEADSYKRRLEGEVGTLQCLVPASVDAELQRVSHDDPDCFWAEISAADVLFLTPEGREQRVVAAYGAAQELAAVERGGPFHTAEFNIRAAVRLCRFREGTSRCR